MKFLKKLDSVVDRVISTFLGVAMMALMFISFLQVLTRYVFKISIGGFEEMPLYLMVVSIWLGSILLNRDGSHVQLDILVPLIKSKKILRILNTALDLIAAVALVIFSVYLFEYMLMVKEAGTISAGMQFPMWWLSAILLLCAVLMALYTVVGIIRRFAIKEGQDGNSD